MNTSLASKLISFNIPLSDYVDFLVSNCWNPNIDMKAELIKIRNNTALHTGIIRYAYNDLSAQELIDFEALKDKQQLPDLTGFLETVQGQYHKTELDMITENLSKLSLASKNSPYFFTFFKRYITKLHQPHLMYFNSALQNYALYCEYNEAMAAQLKHFYAAKYLKNKSLENCYNYFFIINYDCETYPDFLPFDDPNYQKLLKLRKELTTHYLSFKQSNIAQFLEVKMVHDADLTSLN
ncbi:hypothetical protein DNU06_10035 [Putridiphycobacter roseus]|uniref:Uncharacterized protein n=1 Tax=Putridiphycobacter roseus TaxID=2219161 RepID=A0A2W1N049_9FLAO|nr:hypothetical protein [Putridiphycobacter roseus]PZE17074.1 hypothetical protein DNU06_10035 [Putridiphycobacter roseus]